MDDKRLLRASVLAARGDRPAEQRLRDERSIALHAVAHYGAARVVTAYASVGTEPPMRETLERLRDGGVRVLLPIVAGADLAWGTFHGWSALQPGPLGLLQPLRDDDGADAARAADATLVPALAVGRDGHRLGRGGGYFDRWLGADVGGRMVVAVVYDDEVRDTVPHEPHDISVTAALTPSGVVALDQ